MANRPEPEIDITPELVTALLREQAPEFLDLDVRPLNRGWDNTNWRLGDDLVARVPHRAVAASLIEHEQRWLPVLAERLTVAIPTPVFAGRPSADIEFPWPWSIVPWFAGDQAASAPRIDELESARRLGTFYAELHQPAPADAPTNPHRGGPLADRRDRLGALARELSHRIDADAAVRMFNDAAAAPLAQMAVWLHGDLHTRNMVVDDGALTAVIDWGDIGVGDRSCDLAGTFMLTPSQLSTVQNVSGATDADWARARGWALNFALLYLAHGDDDPVQSGVGVRLLETLGIAMG